MVYKAVIMQGHILSHFTVFFNRSRFTTTVLQIVFTLSNNLGQKKKNNAVKVTQNIENLEALRKREKE